MSIGLIIPCFNDSENLNITVLKKIIKSYDNLKLCFVNNGGSDKNIKYLKKLQNKYHKNVSVIDMKKIKGKNSAIKAGSRFLYSINKVQNVGCIDLNTSKTYSEIKHIIENLKMEE